MSRAKVGEETAALVQVVNGGDSESRLCIVTESREVGGLCYFRNYSYGYHQHIDCRSACNDN